VIISIISQKGGTGKSTIAINLSLALAGLSGKPDVALVDCDLQRSSIDTLSIHKRDNLALYAAHEKPHRLIEKLKHKVVVVDTTGYSSDAAYQCAAVSNVVLVPCKPSPLDVRSMAVTVKALTVIREKYNPSLKCRFIVNMVAAGTTLAKEIRATLEKIYPSIPVMDTVLHERQAYKQSLLSGLSCLEFDKRSLAAQEIGQLFLEVVRIAKGK